MAETEHLGSACPLAQLHPRVRVTVTHHTLLFMATGDLYMVLTLALHGLPHPLPYDCTATRSSELSDSKETVSRVRVARAWGVEGV